MAERVSRREAMRRIAATGLVFGGAATAAKFAFDPGGFDLANPQGERQVRDFAARMDPGSVVLSIAKSTKDAAALTRRAVEGLGGMGRFISRGDIVAIKPNIG